MNRIINLTNFTKWVLNKEDGERYGVFATC